MDGWGIEVVVKMLIWTPASQHLGYNLGSISHPGFLLIYTLEGNRCSLGSYSCAVHMGDRKDFLVSAVGLVQPRQLLWEFKG